MNLQKITIYGVTLPRNATLAGTTGYIVNMLVHQDSHLPVYMVRTPEGTIAPVSEDFEDFVIWGRCGNCDNEVDVRTLTDDYYEECLDCVAWFQEKAGVTKIVPEKQTQMSVTANLAKIALTNTKKGKTYYGK